jgi:acyl carrier protein
MSMSDELESRVIRILSDVLDVPASQLNTATTRDDVESWDSVGIVNILTALEVELGVSIPIDDAAEMISVAKILSIVRQQLSA